MGFVNPVRRLFRTVIDSVNISKRENSTFPTPITDDKCVVNLLTIRLSSFARRLFASTCLIVFDVEIFSYFALSDV